MCRRWEKKSTRETRISKWMLVSHHEQEDSVCWMDSGVVAREREWTKAVVMDVIDISQRGSLLPHWPGRAPVFLWRPQASATRPVRDCRIGLDPRRETPTFFLLACAFTFPCPYTIPPTRVACSACSVSMSDRPSSPSAAHLEPPHKGVEVEDPGAQESGTSLTLRCAKQVTDPVDPISK
jgi:hypothetical protein